MRERPSFGFERPFVVSRPGGFTCNGHRYQSSDPFDWQALGLTQSQIWNLWMLGEVDTVEPSDGGSLAAAAKPNLAAPALAAKPAPNSPVGSDAPPAAEHIAPAAAAAPPVSSEGASTAGRESAAPAVTPRAVAPPPVASPPAPPAQLELGTAAIPATPAPPEPPPSSPAKPAASSKGAKPSANPLLAKSPILAKR